MNKKHTCPECDRLRALISRLVESQDAIDQSYGPACRPGWDGRALDEARTLWRLILDEARREIRGVRS